MQLVGRYQNKASFIGRRKELRRSQTKAEWELWKVLRGKQLNVRFRRQYNIDYYIVDFYCHKLKLIIELDGWVHGEEERQKHDAQRDLYLKNQGYHILRYRNEQIKYEFDAVMDNIVYHITRLQRTQDPSYLP